MDYILKTNPDGSVITIRDVQNVLLGMLKDIDALCRKHNIPYFLNGGSALGAVRHHGFIPWDDDADIAMMRSDFEKLLKVVHELGDQYVAHAFAFNKKYNVLIPAMKIRKKGTYIKEINPLLANQIKDCDGLFVDVFVYDYVNPTMLLDLPLRLLNQGLMPIIAFFENLRLNPIPLKHWFVANAKLYGWLNRASSMIGMDITWTFKAAFKPFVFKKSDIYPVQRVLFEDVELPIPNHPHEYLCTMIAPSYMTPPPEDKRVAKHITDISL
jgi:lipopolysaccharide cholinephosphotransferase